MKRLCLRYFTVLAVMITCVSNAFAATYEYTLADGDFSNKKFENNVGGVTWKLDGNNLSTRSYDFANNFGLKFGSGNNPFSSLILSTSDIKGTITSIKVNASGAKDTKAKLTVLVGDIKFGDVHTLEYDNVEYKFSGNSSGQIVISFSQEEVPDNENKGEAIYIKSISVTYEDGTVVVKKDTKVTFGEYDGKTIKIKEGEEAPNIHADVYATDDLTTPIGGAVLSYSSSDEDIAHVGQDGKVTFVGAFGKATITAEFAGNDNYNASKASYTIDYQTSGKIVFDAVKYKSFRNLGVRYSGVKNNELIDNNETSHVFKCYMVRKKDGNSSANSTIQMSPENGYIVSPEFNFASGYKVIVSYSSNEKGDLTLKIEDKSVQGEAISSSGGTSKRAELITFSANASFTIANNSSYTASISRIEIIPNSESAYFSLDEKEDNSSAISENNGKAVDVTLTRTLDNEAWNTLCLPFSVDAATVTSTFGEGTKLKEYASDDVNSITFKDTTAIEAGKPYFIIPGKEKVENPTFTGVTINADASKVISGTNFDIVGIYSPTKLDADTELFVGADNKLYRPSGSNTLNGMRAFIRVKNTDVTPSSIMLGFGGDGQTTGISSAVNDNAAKSDGMIYNLNGQAVGKDASKLGKGLYIINGKKVIVK